MNHKRLLAQLATLILCVLLTHLSFAQNKVITGKVTDSTGSGVQGASITVKGSRGGVQTSAEGTFQISVPPGATTINVSSVGYDSQEISIGGQTNISISLIETNATMNEVVVVGYGTARRRDLTGSVSSVQAKDFNRGQINSPQQLLQGKVPGLQITNSSGQPGGITVVKIRGNNSIRAGNTPLYVVDGVPLDGRSPRPSFSASGVGQTPGGDPLTFINPAEVASIDVLKDASASAIYGSRGANGVILITTRKGSSGPAKLEAGATVGFSDVMRKVGVLDAAGYRSALKQYNAPLSDSGANIDPFQSIIRSSLTQNYSLALSGGNSNGKYRASFLASDQDGIVLKTNLKKYVANFNGQYKFFDQKLSIDFSATAANVAEQIAPISQNAGSGGNLVSLGLIWNPTLSLYNRNGTFKQTNPSGQVNPLALSAAYNDVTDITTILGNFNAAYKLTPWLEYRLLYGLNYGTAGRNAEIQGWIRATGGNAPGNGIAAVLNNKLFSQTVTHTLNFNKKIVEGLTLNALAGYEYWKTNFSGNGSTVFGFDYNLDQTKLIDIRYFNNMQDGKRANLNTFSFKDPSVEIQSYFGRAVLNYKDRYLFTGTFRADGSSKFGKNNKYAYFPSAAVAWNITNEEFMKDLTFFNSLKLRAAYGETGNQEFATDAALDVYRYNSNGNSELVHPGNPNLKWETVKAVDIGLDFAVFKGRIYGAIDYFSKTTNDPLFLNPLAQPGPPNGASIFVNLSGSSITNKGVEFGVGADIVQTAAFNWSINANVTLVKNKFIYPPSGTSPLVFTGALNGQGTSGAFSEAIAHNQPIAVFYVNRFSGYDKDGIGIYSATPQYVGDPNPSTFVGFTTDLSYKKLALNIGTHGSFGNKIYNNTAMSVLNISNIIGGRNIASGIVSTPENTANAITPSTRFLENGNFLKVGNVSLRYNFGDVGKTIKGLSLFVSANNLFVITDYKGFDPEVNVDKALNGIPSVGIDYIGYPTQRTVLFGLNFSL
ncbi:MAG: SusC/RagA family TonB-linked outer membrane protein [Chitinophagaceae bacterium]